MIPGGVTCAVGYRTRRAPCCCGAERRGTGYLKLLPVWFMVPGQARLAAVGYLEVLPVWFMVPGQARLVAVAMLPVWLLVAG